MCLGAAGAGQGLPAAVAGRGGVASPRIDAAIRPGRLIETPIEFVGIEGLK